MVDHHNPTRRYIPKTKESRDLNRHLPTHVHISIIYNSQKVEATEMIVSRGMDNKMWHILSMEYYITLKRKETISHSSNIDEL